MFSSSCSVHFTNNYTGSFSLSLFLLNVQYCEREQIGSKYVFVGGSRKQQYGHQSPLFFLLMPLSPFPLCSVDCACVLLPVCLCLCLCQDGLLSCQFIFSWRSALTVYMSYFSQMTMISSILLTSPCFHTTLQTRPDQTRSAFLPVFFLVLFLLILFLFLFLRLYFFLLPQVCHKQHKRLQSHHIHTHTRTQLPTLHKQQNIPLSFFNYILSALVPSHSLLPSLFLSSCCLHFILNLSFPSRPLRFFILPSSIRPADQKLRSTKIV